MIKEIARYTSEDTILSYHYYEHVVGNDVEWWYVGVQRYIADPRYTGTGSAEERFISSNMAKIDPATRDVIWRDSDLSATQASKLATRVRSIKVEK